MTVILSSLNYYFFLLFHIKARLEQKANKVPSSPDDQFLAFILSKIKDIGEKNYALKVQLLNDIMALVTKYELLVLTAKEGTAVELSLSASSNMSIDDVSSNPHDDMMGASKKRRISFKEIQQLDSTRSQSSNMSINDDIGASIKRPIVAKEIQNEIIPNNWTMQDIIDADTFIDYQDGSSKFKLPSIQKYLRFKMV